MGADFILNLNRFSLLIALVIHLGLALFIYFHNRKSEVSRAFGMMLFSIVFWIFSFTMLLFVRNPDWVLFYRRLAPAGASFIAAAILYFSMVFPATEIKKGFWFKLALFLPAFIVFFESMFTNNMVEKFIFTDVVYAFAGRPVFGPFYYAFAAYFMIYFFTAMGIFFRKYRKPTSPVEKMQVWYVLFGIFSAGILALLASLLLPLFGISELYFLGPLFTIISSFCISYAIVRYRLLSIEEFLLRIVMLLAGITAMTGT
ncbi:MAG: hypothetical protein NT099_07500, partial [Candidatus Saganbacteria bacterium]|nr:hypothetical protein [Candidatus Saganbacteria bacterium]